MTEDIFDRKGIFAPKEVTSHSHDQKELIIIKLKLIVNNSE